MPKQIANQHADERTLWLLPVDDIPCAFNPKGKGLFAEAVLFGQTQRLRWLAPGEFAMGSPEDEPERSDEEGPQHRVRLTKGVWLADTACTQALWLAVMGSNPSQFKEHPSCPVEQVCWEEVQEFLAMLQGTLPPGLEAVLPTEAQWEYACRAGTSTPFSFGSQIDATRVNYNGDLPYNGGDQGLCRGRTVPVKSLPANPWGLYEMHGNVWEWCADGQREYTSDSVQDPHGLTTGNRVVRGGSGRWKAGICRSAYRHTRPAGYARSDIGFRLALRSIETRARPQVEYPAVSTAEPFDLVFPAARPLAP